MNDQGVHGRKGGPEIKIYERQMHVGAVITFFRGRLARGIPERLLVLSFDSMLKGVEGFKLYYVIRARRNAGHRIN